MRDYKVTIDTPTIEYNTSGSFESNITKDFQAVHDETNVFYNDFFAKEDELPVTIFSQELSPLQAIVKHLKDHRNLGFSEISKLINRDPRTIWATYHAVKDLELKDLPTETFIPIHIFANRNLSTLEALVNYLLQSFSISEIASLLEKDYKTIWTIKSRIKRRRYSNE